MIAQNAPRVLQKIHNLYLVVIGQMVLQIALRLAMARAELGPSSTT
jgi:hypothetical protein